MKEIPLRYKNAKWEDVPENIRALAEKMRETRKGIFIHGGVGTGKTHIAYAIGDRMENTGPAITETEAGVRVRPVRVKVHNTTELLRDIREDFDRHHEAKTHTLTNLMEFNGLLILDDIGAEKLSEWVQETFYLLVNRRYEDMLPTIFTSNFNLEELAVRIGDRIVSRIAEMTDVVELRGRDRRVGGAV